MYGPQQPQHARQEKLFHELKRIGANELSLMSVAYETCFPALSVNLRLSILP